MTTAGVLFVLSLVAALVAVHRPFGDYMHRVVAGTRSSRVERGIYRLVGVDPAAGQTWGVYARSVLAFSAVSLLFLYAFQRLQSHLWLSLGFDPVVPHAGGQASAALLRDWGFKVDWHDYPMAHQVCGEEIDALAGWLGPRLG